MKMLLYLSIVLSWLILIAWIAVAIIILINLPADFAELRNKKIRFKFQFWNLHWFFIIYTIICFFNPCDYLVRFMFSVMNENIVKLFVVALKTFFVYLFFSFLRRYKNGGK